MNIAIFGGAGFIGRHLARKLLSLGHKIVVIDNLCVEPAEPLPKGVAFVKANTRDLVIRAALNHGPEVIYWLQAKQGYKNSWKTYAHENIEPVYNFFRAVELNQTRIKKIILASSQAVYEPGLDRDEGSIASPPSVYGMTKLQQEHAFRLFCNIYNIQLIALRYSIVLGAGQSMKSTESGVLRNWYRAYKRGERPKIYGDGKQIRDFVSVSDVTAFNARALNLEFSRIMNVYGFRTTILGLFKIFRSITKCRNAEILGTDIRPGGEFDMTSTTFYNVRKPVVGLRRQVKDFVDFWEKKPYNPR